MKSISVAIILALGMVFAGGKVLAADGDTIKIGVMISLSGGAVSIVGEDMRRGFKMAIDEANARGGYKGTPFEMVIGDDQANPTVAVGLAQRLLVRDNVTAIVGMASSTVVKAVGSIAAQYKKPLFVVAGASPIVEDAFGREPWFFHFLPWEYYRAETAAAFLKSLQPVPQTVAIAYENGVYGSGGAPIMKEHLEAAGFKVVALESFKSGSPSVLPLLSRIKSGNPDILVVMAFPTDDIVIIKQSREVDFSPKLIVLPEIVSKEQFGGTPSDFITGFATWAPESSYPESVRWLAAFRQNFPDRPEPLEYAPMSYMAMKMLLAAIAEVGPGSEAIIHRLETETSDSPFGPVSFSDSKNGHHQVLHRIDILQLQDGKKTVVYPPDMASAKVLYPAPAWKDRAN